MEKAAILTALDGQAPMEMMAIIGDSSCPMDFVDTCYANLQEMCADGVVNCSNELPGQTVLWELV